MARVTVEDCVEKLPNRFELVMLASQRARRIGTGAPLTVDRDNDKNPVVALREIADETVDPAGLKEDLTQSYQKVMIADDEDIASVDMMDDESESLSAMIENQKARGAYADDDADEDDEDDTAEDDDLEKLAGE